MAAPTHAADAGLAVPATTARLAATHEEDMPSYYKGTAHVWLKDSIFQPSNPPRHMAELLQLCSSESTPEAMQLVYTDGGPDHNVRHWGVIIPSSIFSLWPGLHQHRAGPILPRE